MIQQTIAKRPWIGQMSKLTDQVKNFCTNKKALVKMLSDLEGRDSTYESILELFEGQEEILFAVMLQNLLHPKNSHRTDAIKAGKYIEIDTIEQAQAFISSLVEENLTMELKGAESSVRGAFASMASMADIKKLVSAPDVYVAAVALSNKQFYEGRGDRTTFFKVILDLTPSQIPDLGNKLSLITKKDFHGLSLYNDKLCCPDRINKQMLFRLWLHCCRRSNAVTIEQMIAFQPHQDEYLRILDRHVDAEGRTTLNMEEYMAFRARKATEAANKAKQKKA